MGKDAGGAKELRARADVDGDTQKVNDQLEGIVAEEHQRRLAYLKRNEDITRETVDVEVEIRRLQNVIEQSTMQLASLNDQRVELEGNQRRLKREVGDMTRDDEGLKEENEKLSSERTALDHEVTRLKKLKADYISAIAKFKGEKDAMGM
jgi:chromosome segregation ATPase